MRMAHDALVFWLTVFVLPALSRSVMEHVLMSAFVSVLVTVYVRLYEVWPDTTAGSVYDTDPHCADSSVTSVSVVKVSVMTSPCLAPVESRALLDDWQYGPDTGSTVSAQ